MEKSDDDASVVAVGFTTSAAGAAASSTMDGTSVSVGAAVDVNDVMKSNPDVTTAAAAFSSSSITIVDSFVSANGPLVALLVLLVMKSNPDDEEDVGGSEEFSMPLRASVTGSTISSDDPSCSCGCCGVDSVKNPNPDTASEEDGSS